MTKSGSDCGIVSQAGVISWALALGLKSGLCKFSKMLVCWRLLFGISGDSWIFMQKLTWNKNQRSFRMDFDVSSPLSRPW